MVDTESLISVSAGEKSTLFGYHPHDQVAWYTVIDITLTYIGTTYVIP